MKSLRKEKSLDYKYVESIDDSWSYNSDHYDNLQFFTRDMVGPFKMRYQKWF